MRRSSGGHSPRDADYDGILGPHIPVSFRIAREEDLEREEPAKDAGHAKNNMYGVQSLADTIYGTLPPLKKVGSEWSPDGGEDCHGMRRRSTLKPTPQPQTRSHSPANIEKTVVHTADSSPSRSTWEGPTPPSMSHSLTSLSLDSQAPLSSLPSTPKSTSYQSFRQSDEESMDDGGSQAIVSSEDEETELQPDMQDSAPQLIMPSIKMPSRRPFTERGKAVGRLKVLIAGDSGVGKTSLIKSIVQSCEDIVHVDPLSPNLPSMDKIPFATTTKKPNHVSMKATQQITEVYASTKPYPPWWSDIEDTKVLRKRKSVGDTVLERNLCFVDTPGYSKGMSKMEGIQSVLHYIESQLTKPFSASTASEGDIAGLLSGNGGPQVDVVFYLVAQVLKDEDVAFLQRLAAITNVIPLIAKSDIQSFEEHEMLRRSIHSLQHSEIKFFALKFESPTQSYTVCSATADDDENMDASTLMSPDYVQPLIPSELAELIEQIFDPDNMACLRHVAAKKLVQAQGSKIFSIPVGFPQPTSNDRPAATSTSPALSPNASRTIVSGTRGISPYAQARISDHTQQEERLAQIRLAKWASDLQRSLQIERARYEAITRGERAVWLTERLGETVTEGALAPTEGSTLNPQTAKRAMVVKSDVGRMAGHCGLLDAGDPLGLLRWNEALKRKIWIVPIGLLGVIWMVRTWGVGSDGVWSWGWFGEQA